MKTPVIFATLFLLACVFPTGVSATTFSAEKQYALREGEEVTGDLYAVGGTATILGNVFGDLISAGGNVFLGSSISQDALLLGGSADVVGSVGSNLRIISGKSFFRGVVGGDMVVASGELQVLPSSTIAGNLSFAAGRATIDGTVEGNVQGVAGSLTLNGFIRGKVSVTADNIVVGPNAVVEGDFEYSSSRPALISEGARVVGEVKFTEVDTRSRAERFLPTLWGTWIVIKFAVLMLSALVIQGIFRSVSVIFVRTALNDPGWSLVRGFLVVVAVPIAAFLALLTFVGIPFVILGTALYSAFLVLAYLFSPIIAGAFLYRFLFKTENIPVHWKSIVLGVCTVMLLSVFDVVGAILQILLFLLSLGSIYHVLLQQFIRVRQ